MWDVKVNKSSVRLSSQQARFQWQKKTVPSSYRVAEVCCPTVSGKKSKKSKIICSLERRYTAKRHYKNTERAVKRPYLLTERLRSEGNIIQVKRCYMSSCPRQEKQHQIEICKVPVWKYFERILNKSRKQELSVDGSNDSHGIAGSTHLPGHGQPKPFFGVTLVLPALVLHEPFCFLKKITLLPTCLARSHWFSHHCFYGRSYLDVLVDPFRELSFASWSTISLKFLFLCMLG